MAWRNNGKNFKMANKGKGFEELIEATNQQYKTKGVALIQKIATPIKVISQYGKGDLKAVYDKKSTLDFRGTVVGGISVSFDAKETEETEGLPLKNLAPHQYEYIKDALIFGEVSFLLVSFKTLGEFYAVRGEEVVNSWEEWKANPRKRGFNIIPKSKMIKVKSNEGYFINYLEKKVFEALREEPKERKEYCQFCKGSGKIEEKPCWNCKL